MIYVYVDGTQRNFAYCNNFMIVTKHENSYVKEKGSGTTRVYYYSYISTYDGTLSTVDRFLEFLLYYKHYYNPHLKIKSDENLKTFSLHFAT